MVGPSFRDALKRRHIAHSPVNQLDPVLNQGNNLLGSKDDLGMGMALASTSCEPLPSTLVMMTGLALPEGIHHEFYHVPQQTLVATTDDTQDVHSATLLAYESKKDDNDKLLLAQVIYPLEDSTKTILNSNDTVVKNLKQLEVYNSSFEEPSINSTDVKRRKRGEDGKTTTKKKKSQKTSHSTPMP
ncbi:hypothetical protein Ancab_004505 [Ancistrocladus abbreviatus]